MKRTGKPGGDPNRAQALTQYRQRAAVYDLELALFEPIRRMAIARLALQRGDVVLDVGCGTGLSLVLLGQGIGTRGRIIGIDQSPEMIEKARERVVQNHWKNVTLLCSPVELADIPGLADAVLFHFTHDILCRLDAIANVVHHLKPQARVVASGIKWSWFIPVNPFVWSAAWHSVTTLE
ncbi:MAG: class I SAM-dependent methyltransferase, partial [Nevskiaceae bacterium]